MGRQISRHIDLVVYQLAFRSASEIYHLTKTFPGEERFSLTDQIRRSSRSVCSNIAEAWRKRWYKAAFVNKLNSAEAEAAETQVWLQFCQDSGYCDPATIEDLQTDYDHIIGKLVVMIRQADKWIRTS